MRSAVKTRLSLDQIQPANTDLNLAADDRLAERSHAGVIVSDIENINPLFVVFWNLHSTWLPSVINYTYNKLMS